VAPRHELRAAARGGEVGGPIKIIMSWKFCCGRTAKNFRGKCHVETQLHAIRTACHLVREMSQKNVVNGQVGYRTKLSE
jgi:hypothetical protein